MSEDTKGLEQVADELRHAWEEFKRADSERDAEVKKYGEQTAENRAKLEQIEGDLDTLNATLQKAALDTKPEAETDLGHAAKEAFLHFCRKGHLPEGLHTEVKTTLQVRDEDAAGITAPPEFVNEMLKGVIEFSPVRQLARVRPTSANSITLPKRTGTFSAQWTGEGQAISETAGLAYGKEQIPTHELTALVDVTNQLLADSMYNLDAELRSEAAEQFGVAEGTAFISGTGVGRPEGILQAADVSETVTATNDTLAGDDFLSIYYDLKDVYARNGSWLLNRAIVKAARQLKDGNSQYIWAPGLGAAEPATILNRPYYEATDMASAVADDADVAIFGDIRRAYTVVDRAGMSVQRDPYTQKAASNSTRFVFDRRVGGQVVLAEAVRKLNIQ